MTDQAESWSLTALDVDGGKRVYRVRQTLPDGFNKSDFPEVVVVEWQFARVGLPTPEIGETMQAFEAHLDPLDDPASNALLVHVYTGAGIREWCYYVRSYDRFMADLNAALKGKPRFPIQIVHDRDPLWNYREGIKKTSQGKK